MLGSAVRPVRRPRAALASAALGLALGACGGARATGPPAPTPITTIPIGAAPTIPVTPSTRPLHPTAAAPAGHTVVWVLDQSPSQLTPVDLTTGHVGAPIALAATPPPSYVLVDPRGRVAYVPSRAGLEPFALGDGAEGPTIVNDALIGYEGQWSLTPDGRSLLESGSTTVGSECALGVLPVAGGAWRSDPGPVCAVGAIAVIGATAYVPGAGPAGGGTGTASTTTSTAAAAGGPSTTAAPAAYVPEITPVSLTTGAVGRPVVIEQVPGDWIVSVAAAGGELVALTHLGSVEIVDPATGVVAPGGSVAPLAGAGLGPAYVVGSPAGGRAWALAGAGVIVPVDLAGGADGAPVAVGGARAIAITPDGRTLVALNAGGIVEVSAATGAVVSSVSLPGADHVDEVVVTAS